MSRPSISVMLDSGAFSSWTRGEIIKLADYIEFVKRCEHVLDSYVSLDVIPGSLGRAPGSLKCPRTFEQVEVSGSQSYANLQAMKDAGLRPIPVFHQGEAIAWLEKMLRDGEHYLGVSPAKNMPWHLQQRWLDRIFAIVTDRTGAPLIKVHGFGIAYVDWLKRYPFFSVDTAGWLKASVFGKIYVPSYSNESPNYLCRPTLVTVSEESEKKPPKHKYNRDRQLAQLTPEDQTNVTHFVATAGLTLAEVKRSPAARARVLAFYYQQAIATLPDHIRFLPPKSLNASEWKISAELMAAHQPIKLSRPKLYFATNYDRHVCDLLLKAEARHHLLSYCELKNRPDALAAYAVEGKVMARQTRPRERRPRLLTGQRTQKR
jgi:hypothetical protein